MRLGQTARDGCREAAAGTSTSPRLALKSGAAGHLILKKEATLPAADNLLQQQARFDDFIDEYNRERPHQALGMRYPAELCVRSARPYRGIEELDYPFHDHTHIVTRCGRICLDNRKINLRTVFAGQKVGVKQVDDQVWLVSFLEYDLGYFDRDQDRVEPGPNPFAPDTVLTMCPE